VDHKCPRRRRNGDAAERNFPGSPPLEGGWLLSQRGVEGRKCHPKALKNPHFYTSEIHSPRFRGSKERKRGVDFRRAAKPLGGPPPGRAPRAGRRRAAKPLGSGPEGPGPRTFPAPSGGGLRPTSFMAARRFLCSDCECPFPPKICFSRLGPKLSRDWARMSGQRGRLSMLLSDDLIRKALGGGWQ
jgi:hypothetical protein